MNRELAPGHAGESSLHGVETNFTSRNSMGITGCCVNAQGLPLVSGGKRISVLRASSEGDTRWLELGSVLFFVCGL